LAIALVITPVETAPASRVQLLWLATAGYLTERRLGHMHTAELLLQIRRILSFLQLPPALLAKRRFITHQMEMITLAIIKLCLGIWHLLLPTVIRIMRLLGLTGMAESNMNRRNTHHSR